MKCFRYQLSEIIDSQLKQMSEDLKEIVEHLNESNKNEDTSDPVCFMNFVFNIVINCGSFRLFKLVAF